MTAFLTRGAAGRPADLRDLGGTRTDDGYRIRTGVLYRSGAPRPGVVRPAHRPGLPEGSAWPPATVIDLRPDAGAAGDHPLAGVADVRPVPLGASLLGAGAGDELVRIVRIVADAPAPILVHGGAGHDHTGLVPAVLLAALGVPRATILEEYGRPAHDPAPPWIRLRRRGSQEPEHTPRPRVGTATPAGVLDALDAHDDGVPGGLRDAGVSDGDLRRLAERLLEPDLPA
ncbi:tyrosine-protein phosphatase [Pseudonocardia parietis]|uniref:Tyrosine phosphatase family protein n=1 Tax=Pseudonocardia parietis TaxID=570936 RepID=A0ABS4VXZ1_9PSEU|nr:tyrosine-protein phosphatase [Pseudonocardia parietis]MBP2368810.1 hypothetical protein [Pseudonocardia parietis]